jgi:undecaprenyl-diphosphatase
VRRDLVVAVAALVALIALGWLVGAVLGHPRVDATITEWFVDHRSPVLSSAARFATHLGAASVLVAAAVATSLALHFIGRRPPRIVAIPVLALLGTTIISQAVKHAVGRVRPPVALRLTRATGYAFPSGHAIESMAVWGAVGILLSTLLDRRARVAVRISGVALALAVGLSRVYLGVHWATDVVAGWLLGAAWLTVLLRELPQNQDIRSAG